MKPFKKNKLNKPSAKDKLIKPPKNNVFGSKAPFKIMRRDPFGNIIFFKRIMIGVFAMGTYSKFNMVNKIKIEGTEYLEQLPNKGVMFISNHQTYYADVMAMYHIFCGVKWKKKNNINYPLYFLAPRVNMYYVAAEETMKKSGILPKLLSYTGAVTVKRSWRDKGQNVNRSADISAPTKIKKALESGWVVNFPQGTTKPYAPVRKGTAHMIKEFSPIVVPVVIDGFRRAFDKKGLKYKKRGTILKVRFKEPLSFAEDASIKDISDIICNAIEQEKPLNEEGEA